MGAYWRNGKFDRNWLAKRQRSPTSSTLTRIWRERRVYNAFTFDTKQCALGPSQVASNVSVLGIFWKRSPDLRLHRPDVFFGLSSRSHLWQMVFNHWNSQCLKYLVNTSVNGFLGGKNRSHMRVSHREDIGPAGEEIIFISSDDEVATGHSTEMAFNWSGNRLHEYNRFHVSLNVKLVRPKSRSEYLCFYVMPRSVSHLRQ